MRYVWRFLFVVLFLVLLAWGLFVWFDRFVSRLLFNWLDLITDLLSDALDYAGDRCL